MKQLFLNQGKPKLVEVSNPEPQKGFAIIQTMYSFVSTGTERATIENQAKPLLQRFINKFQENSDKFIKSIKNDGVLRTVEKIMAVESKHLSVGYSLSGKVLWACPSTNLFPGEIVACAGSQFANHAQLVLAPKNLIVPVPDANYLAQASAGAVASIALNAFFKSNCTLGQNVLIIGLGTLGSILAQVASSAGCTVFAIEKSDDKRLIAHGFGVSRVFSPEDTGLGTAIKLLTAGNGVDAVFLATPLATAEIFKTAMGLVRPRGKVVVLSEGQIEFPRDEFYRKEVSLVAACSYGPGRYNYDYEVNGVDLPIEFVRWSEGRILELAVKMICQKKIDVQKLIGKRLVFNSSGFEDEYAQSLSSGATGVLIEYPSSQESSKKKEPKTHFSTTVGKYLQKPFKTAVIGAGQFFQSTLMPILKRSEFVNWTSVVDQDSKTALTVGQILDAQNITSSLQDLLSVEVPELAVVATDHASHANLTLELLNSGSAVFLEKPIAITQEQLLGVEDYLNNNRNALFCVDFNRSFSPHFVLARKALEQRATPCVVNYRVNALFLANDHWVYRSGGRIVGEACHMIEFIIALVGSRVRRISVCSLRGVENLSQDNFYSTFEFVDGSIANLCYTSLGSSFLQKEKIEVFWEGRSLVIDDFSSSVGFGTAFKINNHGPVDKGHTQILNNFFSQVERLDFSNNRALYKRAIFASKLSFVVQNLVNQGGGVHECVQ